MRPPGWIDEVTNLIVTMAEGRFGICRILLWFGDGDESDIAVPYPEYTEIERVLGEVSDTAVLVALWRRGLVPADRPHKGAAAECLKLPTR